jgi:hypothetical protein
MELNMAAEQNQPPGSQRSPGHLNKKKTGCGASRYGSWCCSPWPCRCSCGSDRDSSHHLGAIAPGLLILAVLFAAYAYGRRREVSGKVLLKDQQDRVGVAPPKNSLIN